MPAPNIKFSRQPCLFLYLSPLEIPLAPELQRAYQEILSPAEVERNARYATPALRQRDLQTRALLRCALSLHAPVLPGNWQFSILSKGKPVISSHHNDLTAWQFNISDSENMAVIAICKGHAVGVDIELSTVADELLDSAMIFSLDERTSLRKLPLNARRHRFLDHWTMKEAYLKACGVGISIPLNTVALNFEEPGRVFFSKTSGDQLPDTDWVFMQLDMGDYGKVAVCLEGVVAPITKLARFVPLRFPPQDLDFRLLRHGRSKKSALKNSSQRRGSLE